MSARDSPSITVNEENKMWIREVQEEVLRSVGATIQPIIRKEYNMIQSAELRRKLSNYYRYSVV